MELYNPHPTPIPLSGWKMARFNRTSNALSEVCDLYSTLKAAGHPLSIGAGEKIVIQSDPAAGHQPPAAWSARNPPFTPLTCKSATATNDTIANAVDGQSELVLMRPPPPSARP